MDGELLNDIRKAANKGLVLGNERFVAEVEALTGKELHEKKRGVFVYEKGWQSTKSKPSSKKTMFLQDATSTQV